MRDKVNKGSIKSSNILVHKDAGYKSSATNKGSESFTLDLLHYVLMHTCSKDSLCRLKELP